MNLADLALLSGTPLGERPATLTGIGRTVLVEARAVPVPNAASVGLHEALGFRPVGVFRNVGYKLGAWRDVGWWQRPLRDMGAAPQEPRPWAAPGPGAAPGSERAGGRGQP